MKWPVIFTVLLLEIFSPSPAWSETPQNARAEVEFLLGYVDVSGCQFYRNGSWHDSKAAQAHLRSKYQYLSSRRQIDSAEDFIEKAATKSSFSGQPYQVGCPGEAVASSNRWLHTALNRFRASHLPPH